jgi:hypothetical protein
MPFPYFRLLLQCCSANWLYRRSVVERLEVFCARADWFDIVKEAWNIAKIPFFNQLSGPSLHGLRPIVPLLLPFFL